MESGDVRKPAERKILRAEVRHSVGCRGEAGGTGNELPEPVRPVQKRPGRKLRPKRRTMRSDFRGDGRDRDEKIVRSE